MKASDRQLALSLIEEACLAGARRRAACEVLGISLRTLERWEKPEGEQDKRGEARRYPGNRLTEAERSQMLEIANTRYRDEPPSQFVPKLADEGIYIASESSWYRLLRANKLLAHRQASRPSSRKRPKECLAAKPNQVWSWDISYLSSQVRGRFYYLYLILDVFSRKIVGQVVHTVESADHAAALIRQACQDEQIAQRPLVLHADNGSPMKGSTMLATLEQLGVMASFSRPSVSNDNPYSESLFKTLKYCPRYPTEKFADLLQAREWVANFVGWYNTQHLHSGIRFVTPEQRHQGMDRQVLAHRKAVYEQAKRRHPGRWSGSTRNWNPIRWVSLNPAKSKDVQRGKTKTE